jgi:hypothetical protein
MVAATYNMAGVSLELLKVNDVTGQGLTEMGAAATFYDALVEVEKA